MTPPLALRQTESCAFLERCPPYGNPPQRVTFCRGVGKNHLRLITSGDWRFIHKLDAFLSALILQIVY
jgi:hypothetical protein